MDTDQRRFQRIPFDAQITLTLENNNQEVISGALHDISFKGALIAINESYPELQTGQTGTLTIEPEQGEIKLTLTVEVAYVLPQKRLYGLNLRSLDVESAAHLRRLIEVNLGDEGDLQRELTNLIDAMEAEHR